MDNVTRKKDRPLLALVAIALVATLLSAVTYQFFSDAAAKIVDIAADEARIASIVQARDLANSLENKLAGILQNVEVLASAPTVQDREVEKAKTLFAATQSTSDDLTDFYGWLDADGKLVWTSIAAEDPRYLQFLGAGRSDREWFAVPRDSLGGYMSSAIDSLDGIDRLFVSYPIVSRQGGSFEGVVYAGVSLSKLNGYLGSQLYPGVETTTGLMDTKGTILHAAYPELVGLDYFGDEYAATIGSAPVRADDPEGLERFIRQSLEGAAAESGSADFSYGGQLATTAYSHVRVDGRPFAVLYTRVPHLAAQDVSALVGQQAAASWLLISTIGAAAAGTGAFVIRLNKRLERAVDEKAAQLEESNRELAATTQDLQDMVAELAENNKKLQAANEQLQVNDRLQKEFINIAAHELRTPITPILAATDLAEEVRGADGQTRVALSRNQFDIVIRNARRLEQLSSNILDVARIDSQSLKLSKGTVDLNRAISEIVADAHGLVPASRDVRIAFEPYGGPGGLTVRADGTRLYEVMMNLLRNAARFTGEGTITISAGKSADGRDAVVAISDTGAGIAPEMMPRLFQKFASSQSGEVLGGTGLGLYISKSIVEAHGGRIWAENNNADGRGGGATFFFTLPLAASTTTAGATPAAGGTT